MTPPPFIIDVNLPKFNNDRQNNQAGEIQAINTYLASFPSTRKNFQDICKSDRTRTFGTMQACLQFIKKMASKTHIAQQRAFAIFTKNRNYVHQLMDKHRLDALLIPITTQGTATYDTMTVNTWRAPVSSNSGLPSMNINIGYSDDTHMPIGVELTGKQYQEGVLLEIAYAYEMHAPARMQPSMPEENTALLHYSIPELNNLFTFLGKNAYEDVLIHHHNFGDATSELTPEQFRKITAKAIEALHRH